jgi:hypothetical protein
VAAFLLALLVVLILFGLGFAVHVLWWVAIAAVVICLFGFLVRGAGPAAGTRSRWWYWW